MLDSKQTKWELARFQYLADARSFAIEHGWRATPQKVQIRTEATGFGSLNYVVEPFEKECSCPNIVKPF